MKKKRIIPVILYSNGFVVQAKQFRQFQNIGNAADTIKRYSEWSADELIFLNIGENKNDIRRDDIKYKNKSKFLQIIKMISKNAFIPISVGGKIKNINDAKKLFKVGADKIVLNSEFVKNPLVLKEFSHSFGAQSIVISLDFKKINGRYKIFYNSGKIKSQNNEKYLFSIINQYAGEVLINSIDYDGLGEGYDYNLINYVYKYLRKPIILCGGAGEYSHFAKALKSNKLDGVSSANFFQFQDQSVYYAKKYLYDKKFNVRKPSLFNIKR